MASRPDNQQIADRLREAADLLAQQDANPFRVNAYRRASITLAGLPRPIDELFAEQGHTGLTDLPGIGDSLAGAIEEMLRTGRWGLLNRLRGGAEPERLFQTIPGVGPTLARELHDELHVDTLEALELAAHDGRLEGVKGVGPRRAAMIRSALAAMLQRRRPLRTADGEPSIHALLDVDREYRQRAERDKLPTIAPRRFNPKGEAWLPVLHTERGDWHFTVLFSNTARAHELGRTHDWVVIYYQSDREHEGQRTVVTETHGALTGKRVVRGRETECRDHYALEPPRDKRTS